MENRASISGVSLTATPRKTPKQKHVLASTPFFSPLVFLFVVSMVVSERNTAAGQSARSADAKNMRKTRKETILAVKDVNLAVGVGFGVTFNNI